VTTHDLKLWPQFWDATVAGGRSFDIRNNDRGFKVDDVVRLREWDPGIEPPGEWPGYTGRECYRRITYVLHAEDCPAGAITAGYVALAMVPTAAPWPTP
jgi:Domain of unknown function (DUF3850)